MSDCRPVVAANGRWQISSPEGAYQSRLSPVWATGRFQVELNACFSDGSIGGPAIGLGRDLLTSTSSQ